jgi:hypothetical protein
MNIFKKIAGLFKKKQKKQENWFNDADRRQSGEWSIEMEGGLCGDREQRDHMVVNQIVKR